LIRSVPRAVVDAQRPALILPWTPLMAFTEGWSLLVLRDAGAPPAAAETSKDLGTAASPTAMEEYN